MDAESAGTAAERERRRVAMAGSDRRTRKMAAWAIACASVSVSSERVKGFRTSLYIFQSSIINLLKNRTALHAALKKFNNIIFFTLHLIKLIKNMN